MVNFCAIKGFFMNKKLFFLVMLVCLLALSLALVGCKTDDDDDRDSIPAALVGRWGFSAGGEQFRINADGTGTQGDPASIITPTNCKWSVNGKRLSFSYINTPGTGSADYSITNGKLTFSNLDANDPLSNYFQYFIAQATVPMGLGPLVKLSDSGNGGGNIPASLISKWYFSQADADADSHIYPFEITSDGKLLLQMGLVSYDLTVSGNTITAKTTGLTLGSATYSVDGTKLTLTSTGGVTNIFNAITTNGNSFFK